MTVERSRTELTTKDPKPTDHHHWLLHPINDREQ